MTSPFFTPTQASALTGLSVKSVNKAIEDHTVPVKSVREGRVHKRYISYGGLICLELQAQGLGRLPLHLRKDVYQRVVRSYRAGQLRYMTALVIDIHGARQKLVRRLLELRNAKRIVVSDPETMGGVPVFKGTRVPVYAIADMLSNGASAQEILDGYPSLSEEMLHAARVYTEAYPKRGRPTANPWTRNKPARHTVKALASGGLANAISD